MFLNKRQRNAKALDTNEKLDPPTVSAQRSKDGDGLVSGPQFHIFAYIFLSLHVRLYL